MKQDKPEGYFENDAKKKCVVFLLLATIKWEIG